MGSTSEIREPLLSVDEREPLAPDRSAPSSFMETHAIYSTSNRYGNPNGFGAFIRKALGIYSYKVGIPSILSGCALPLQA